jgi:hypothetical protein
LKRQKKDAATLSKKLGTHALTFLGEDTSGSMQCDLFNNGKPLGAESWLSQDDAADGLLKKLGVYIPACYARKTKEAAWLSVCPASQGKIKSAALIFD